MRTGLVGSILMTASLTVCSCNNGTVKSTDKGPAKKGSQINADANAIAKQPVETADPVKVPATDNPNSAVSNDQTNATAPASTATGARDCRDDYPTYGWKRTTENECSKVKGWLLGAGGMDGVLPSMAFVTCKINNECMRFATANNCDYEYWPKGKIGVPLGQRDATKYCRKDYKNYTFFRCFIAGQPFIAQSTDGTSYQDYSVNKGNIVSEVAANLPLNEGCPDKVKE